MDNNLKHTTNKEAREFIQLMFEGYKKRKEDGRLYQKDDNVPQIIIDNYLSFVTKPSFNDLITTYKEKYILNESAVEPNMSKEERMGLADVYDFIKDFDFNKNFFNVFTTSMQIHNKLYKHCGDGTFGGHLRESTAVLQDVNIDIATPQEAKIIFNQYIAKNNYFDKLKNDDIFGYIADCVKLNVELIKLQPFADGNKRTFRSLLNLLLKKINIPPIYIEQSEAIEYKKVLIKAMQATSLDDYNDIIQFYYYKICDAIMTLDINHSKVDGKAFNKLK